MAVVWSKEVPKGRSVSGKRSDGSVYKREYLIRVDDPATSLLTIINAPGLNYGDAHPDDASVFLDSYDCKPTDESGMLYLLSVEYRKQTPEDQSENNDEPGALDFRPPVWGGSSSVTSQAVYKDRDGEVLKNSAGDPLEDLAADTAEERLTLTQYYYLHTDWMQLARDYTNAINSDAWNGGAATEWKCQGCSKKLNIENKNGTTIVYWEVTWEFAYKKDGWLLRCWDIGFAQLVDANGEPSSQGTQRAQIKGQDGKAVRQPVGLDGAGMAVAAGQPPAELAFFMYPERPFGPKFGEVFTPNPLGG